MAVPKLSHHPVREVEFYHIEAYEGQNTLPVVLISLTQRAKVHRLDLSPRIGLPVHLQTHASTYFNENF